MEIEIAFLIMDKVVEEHCVTVGREAWRIIRKEYCGSGQNSAAGKKAKVSLPDGEHNKSSFQFPDVTEVLHAALGGIIIDQDKEVKAVKKAYNFLVGNKKR